MKPETRSLRSESSDPNQTQGKSNSEHSFDLLEPQTDKSTTTRVVSECGAVEISEIDSDDNIQSDSAIPHSGHQTKPRIKKPKTLGDTRSRPSQSTKMKLCTPQCSRTDEKNMLRCCSCMTWHHTSCIGEEATYVGNWNCSECRHVPDLVYKILACVQESKQTINDLATKVTILEHKMDIASNEITTQRRTNDDLVQQIDSQSTIIDSPRSDNKKLQSELIVLKENTTTNKPAPMAKPILTIGSSILRDIKSKNPKELVVQSISGAKNKDVSSALTKMSKDKMTFSKVIS